jgi:drug/metabolite transporter (DMT)-like permease
MKAEIKSSMEYALITLIVAGLCLWQLIAIGTQEADLPAAKMAIIALGLIIAGSMHCVFMMQLVRRTGRAFWPWFVAVVIFMPVGTAVLLALLLSDSDATQT